MNHQHISLFKSGTRIFGYVLFLLSHLFPVLHQVELVGVSVIIFGEVLGILEEFVTK